MEFCPANSWWDDFAALNRYVTRCQSFLQAGESDNDVLLYAPFYDRWMQRGNGTMPHFTIGGTFPGQDVGRALVRSGISFDFISDRQLASVTFADGAIRSGGIAYKAIMLPETKYIPLATLEKLFFLAHEGATIVFEKALPSDVPGLADLEKRRRALRTMTAALTPSEALQNGVNEIRLGAGHILVGAGWLELFKDAAIRPETMVEQGLEFVRRRIGEKQVYFIVNRSDKACDGWVPLTVAASSVAIFDPMNGAIGRGAVKKVEGGGCEVYLQLAAGKSCLVETFEKAARRSGVGVFANAR